MKTILNNEYVEIKFNEFTGNVHISHPQNPKMELIVCSFPASIIATGSGGVLIPTTHGRKSAFQLVGKKNL